MVISYFEDTDGSSKENLSYSKEEDDDETISDIEMDDIASLKSSKTTVTDYYALDSILRSSTTRKKSTSVYLQREV